MGGTSGGDDGVAMVQRGGDDGGMQRTEDDGIIISCDFCGSDWDPTTGLPTMTEGHRGSAMCLGCLERALPESEPASEPFDCALCLQTREAGMRRWSHPSPTPSPGLAPSAAVCWECVRLAAKTFHKDKDIDFRWDPSQWGK